MLDEVRAAHAEAFGSGLVPDLGAIVATPLPSAPSCFVGRTHAGETCLLIGTSSSAPRGDIRLRHLEVMQSVRCAVSRPGGPQETLTGSLVVCRSGEPRMVELFLRLAAEAIAELGPTPSADAIARWVQDLSALFSRLETAGRKLLRGLWAELLVIHEAADPAQMLRHWQARPGELLDFIGAGLAIEVKSCQDLERVHQFSLAQLRPPADLEVWVASVPVRPDPHGVSTLDLLARVEALLPTAETRAAARSVVFATAGDALNDDQHHRFELEIARAGLRFMDARVIPSLAGPAPEEVLDVTLTVRCRDVPAVGTAEDVRSRL